jgi:hypothetical protein
MLSTIISRLINLFRDLAKAKREMGGLGATTTTATSKRFSAGLVWVLSLFLPPSSYLT